MNIFGSIPAAKAADKQLLFATIRYICYLDKKSKRDGFLALEECLCCDEDNGLYVKTLGEDEDCDEYSLADYPVVGRFMAQMLRFLIDGYDSSYMIDYASYVITSSQSAQREGVILACMIIAEGMVSLKKDYIYPAFRNDDSRRLVFRLASMLGFGMSEEFIDIVKNDSFFGYIVNDNSEEAAWRKIIESKGGHQ